MQFSAFYVVIYYNSQASHLKPLGKDDHLNVNRSKITIWNPSFVDSNVPRVCRTLKTTTITSHGAEEQNTQESSPKDKKDGDTDGASKKILKSGKEKANSPVNLDKVLLIFTSIDAKTQWNNEKDVDLALKCMIDITRKPRFELEWGFATEQQRLVGIQLLQKIMDHSSQEDSETKSIVENLSKKLHQGWL